MKFETPIDINASAETIFSVLCDFEAYPEWHPSVAKVEGKAELGEWLRIHLIIGNREVPVSALITACEEGKTLEWRGSIAKQGPFRAPFLIRHAFRIEERGEGARFTNEEAFRGLTSLLGRVAKPSLVKGYKEVNQALKKRAESLQPLTG